MTGDAYLGERVHIALAILAARQGLTATIAAAAAVARRRAMAAMDGPALSWVSFRQITRRRARR